MLNKHLVYIVSGLLFPILFYLLFYSLRQVTVVPMAQFGLIEDVLLDTKLPLDSRQHSATTTFVGDVLLARNVEFLMKAHSTQYPFKNVSALLIDSANVIGNFESAVLVHHITTPSFTTRFSVDVQYLPLLAHAGFTHFSLANNHSFDYGSETFANTETSLAAVGLKVFGHPQKVISLSSTIVQSGDYTLGIIALNSVSSAIPWDDIRVQISDVGNRTDYQIVYIHWGEEYRLKHNADQEVLAKKLIDAGIDAVIGSHPHVTQDIQVYKNRPIFYSLGNFIFDQYFSVDVQQGLLLNLTFKPNNVVYQLVPISSEGALSQPYSMALSESALFLKNLARRSDLDYTQDIQSGLLILPYALATSAQTSTIEP